MQYGRSNLACKESLRSVKLFYMGKRDKERLEELEKRVRELEARPYWPTTIIVQPALQPSYPEWSPGYVPWIQPIWYVDHSTLPQVTVTTSGTIS